jgi:hypothetical protein
MSQYEINHMPHNFKPACFIVTSKSFLVLNSLLENATKYYKKIMWSRINRIYYGWFLFVNFQLKFLIKSKWIMKACS